MLLNLALIAPVVLQASCYVIPVNSGNTSSAAPKATVKNGTIIGKHLANYSQDLFLGIPYCLPVTGQLRLQRPWPINVTYPDEGLDASEYSPICPGHGGQQVGYPIDEDCLTLNVVRSATTSSSDSLPVMLWIHGGDSIMGSSRDARYNLTYIVQRSVTMGTPIIGVSINYRLDEFGYLWSKEIQDNQLANLGYWDQRFALQWVQENIAAFGGDPKKVTIWGESAGGWSVSAQLLAFGGQDDSLFRAAIMESGSPTTPTYPTLDSIQPDFDAFVTRLDCANTADVLGCLRAVPWKTYWSANGNLTTGLTAWTPVIDGDFNPTFPSQLLKNKAFVKVPILSGANNDEGTLIGPASINTDQDILNALAASYPLAPNSTLLNLISAYSDEPADGCPFGTGDLESTKGALNKKSDAIYGDLYMIAPRRAIVEAYASAGVPTWSYRFMHVPFFSTPQIGAAHFLETPYVFGNPLPNGTAPTGTSCPLGDLPEDIHLSEVIQSQWISFAVHLDPNQHGVEGVASWPDYRSGPANLVYGNSTEGGIRSEVDNFRGAGITIINEHAVEFGK